MESGNIKKLYLPYAKVQEDALDLAVRNTGIRIVASPLFQPTIKPYPSEASDKNTIEIGRRPIQTEKTGSSLQVYVCNLGQNQITIKKGQPLGFIHLELKSIAPVEVSKEVAERYSSWVHNGCVKPFNASNLLLENCFCLDNVPCLMELFTTDSTSLNQTAEMVSTVLEDKIKKEPSEDIEGLLQSSNENSQLILADSTSLTNNYDTTTIVENGNDVGIMNVTPKRVLEKEDEGPKSKLAREENEDAEDEDDGDPDYRAAPLKIKYKPSRRYIKYYISINDSIVNIGN